MASTTVPVDALAVHDVDDAQKKSLLAVTATTATSDVAAAAATLDKSSDDTATETWRPASATSQSPPPHNPTPTPPPSYNDSVPAGSIFPPTLPPRPDSTSAIAPVLPPRPTHQEEEEQAEADPQTPTREQPQQEQQQQQQQDQSAVQARSLSLSTAIEEPRRDSATLPPPQLIETPSSPVLTKTRGRQSPTRLIKQHVVSTPMLLHKALAGQPSSSEADQPRGRSVSTQPLRPHTRLAVSGTRAVSSNRGHSSHSSDDSNTQSPHRTLTPNQRRRSWLPGGGGGTRSRSNSHEPPAVNHATAWVLSAESRAEYNVSYLTNGEKVPELWDESGSLYVYLSPRDSKKGASFKVRASILDQSRVLTDLVNSEMASPVSARSRARSFGGRDTLDASDAHRVHSPPTSPPLFGGGESRLHLPVDSSDLERLIALRNLFALLTGQPLVADRAHPTAFTVLSEVSNLLREFDFGGGVGSASFGEAVDLSLGFYINQNGLADVRHSREKTLEALVLGEQLRFWPLYNEAFCHAVGKYPALRDIKSPLWNQISANTRLRLERAHLDLANRQHSVNTRLEQFEFPSLFAGVGSSTSNEVYRNLRFKNWRTTFNDMKSFVLKYYKTQFGSWPPKASSRRNPFSESGLNRLVLKTLYADLCSVYDLLADRTSLTPRVSEDGHAASSNASDPALSDPAMMALRQILGEFDQSSPPVLPPIPFDIPKVPTLASIRETFADMAPKDQARFGKNVQSYELQVILQKSHNADAERPLESPFLAAFEEFEAREAKHGKTEMELAEMRIGQWLFLYVVLQSMPMLVVDAPGLHYAEGVEYFLCEPPQGRPPWVEDAGEVRKAWFQTAGGAGPLVELSADVLLYSVEATYHRSHCWLAAKQWEGRGSISAPPGDLVPSTGSGIGSSGAAGPGSSGSGTAGFQIPRSATLPELPISDLSLAAPSSVGMSRLGSLDAASTTSSPRLPPNIIDESTENPSPGSMSPALRAQQLPQAARQTPPLSFQQHQQQAFQRPNYQQLQQRNNLRHASIGWALEPVRLSDDNDDYGQDQGSNLQPPFHNGVGGSRLRSGSNSGNNSVDNARRIASAGNLRSMMDANNSSQGQGIGGDTRNGSVGSIGSLAPSQSQSSLTVPHNSGSTFDDILGSMDKEKKVKKRSSFLKFR